MSETQMHQQSAEHIETMIPQNAEVGSSISGSHVETQRLDPHTSLGDYNRTMLEYTQRQMSSFVDLDDAKSGSGTSSRSSQSSGNSGTSSNGVLAGQANGPAPTSASAARHAQQRHKAARSPNEAKPSRY